MDSSIETPHPGRSATTRRGRGLRLAVLVLGVGLMVAGIAVVAGPLYGMWQRGHADQSAVAGWLSGGSADLVGPPRSAGAPAGVPTCGSGAPSDYALVVFSALSRYGYAGVAGDGDWSLLDSRSMVHYKGTPDPGQAGNVILAFHREPDFQHIDEMGVGSKLTVQDRTCHVFTYRVTTVSTMAPEKFSTELNQTTGHDLTLITCTPWWIDSQRIVWKATLVS